MRALGLTLLLVGAAGLVGWAVWRTREPVAGPRPSRRAYWGPWGGWRGG